MRNHVLIFYAKGNAITPLAQVSWHCDMFDLFTLVNLHYYLSSTRVVTLGLKVDNHIKKDDLNSTGSSAEFIDPLAEPKESEEPRSEVST